MGDQAKRAAAAVVTACSVLLAGACAPLPPKAAWWCTAFSVACDETVAQKEDCEKVEFRCKLVDWWQELAG